jgi:hypothetical protein
MSDPVQLSYAGRPIQITGNTAPLHRYRGFFSGDDWDPHHHGEEGEHMADVTVAFDGQVFELHRTTDGDLHSHDLPTLSFTSFEQAAETIARLVDGGYLHGRPAESEPAQ